MQGVNYSRAPEKGILLAYFPDALVFERYTITNDGLRFENWQHFQEKTPVECHLFDGNTEYRMVTRAARNDRIELLLTKQEAEQMDPDLVYTEDVLVKEEYSVKGTLPKRLRIVNRYIYTENDVLVLKNYRIAEI